MNNRQMEAAFKDRFGGIVNVKPGFDHEDDPAADMKIDGEAVDCSGQGAGHEGAREDLLRGAAGRSGQPRLPCVHFIAKSDIGERNPAAA